MVTFLGLGAALAYGAADFLGGAAARRATALKVVGLCIPVGLVVLLAAALLSGRASGGTPTVHGLAWGFGSGLAGGMGLIAFYRALARGPMSVVAPVSALAAAVLPVAVGTLRGERLGVAVLIGVVLCLAAIGLVSMEGGGPPQDAPAGRRLLDSGPVMAIVSGTAFGVFLVLLDVAGGGSGLWPLVAARTAGSVVIGLALLVVGARRALRTTGADRPPEPRVSGGGTLALVVSSGILDAAANVLYFLAAERGMLSLAAVLASLYPAVTVSLARLVYSERLRAIQRVGLVVALAGVALVTAG